MSITLGNPIIITSGTLSSLITPDYIKVKQLYWHQPDLTSTSNLILRKGNMSGAVITRLQCEVSGQTQIVKTDQWVDRLFVDCMPTGELHILTH